MVVGFLLTEEEKKKNKSSLRRNRNGRTIEYLGGSSRKMGKWYIQCIVNIFYKCNVILLETINLFALTKFSLITLTQRNGILIEIMN